ncbi:hypothetical protein [Streptomyces sp. 4N124]|uniref:hypothetical protein n=1 Tax=Streptomyces sp. 4N124 TaxID=3457420 RepID=UPI003FD2E38C
MKVRITITVNVDADAWALEYGIDPPEVRADVKEYLGNAIAGIYPSAENIITDVEWR